jgi:hypothetical protein
MTDAVTHHADSVTHHAIPDAADKASNRRKQVREANVRYRARRRAHFARFWHKADIATVLNDVRFWG